MYKRKKKTTCSKCKGELEPERKKAHQTYCRNCHNEYMRLNRPKHSELPEEQKKRRNCKSYLRVYLKRGKIKIGFCNCGNIGTQAIHEDYSKPLIVKWVCKNCKPV